MTSLMSFVTHSFLFASIYIQVFLLITLFEFQEQRRARKAYMAACPPLALEQYPSITVIVPCFNEAETVVGTIESLKRLNYPQDKIVIMAVDDGSTDDTWSYLERYANDPQVLIHRKENGGKHTVVNFGIARASTDLVSCLDADSFVHPDALVRMLPYFADPETVAVTPAIKIRTPQNMLEYMQYAEYNIGIFLRKMYSTFNAIHVTPGPFSVFRRSVFERVGPFRAAHNTEDLEFALRLHDHNLKIENSHTSFVYTKPPRTVKALVRQRVRWTTGFLLNVKDYRHLLFSRSHGHIGTFTLPAGVLSLVTVIFLASCSVVNAATNLATSLSRYGLVGFHWHWPSWQWFFVNTTTERMLTLTLLASALFILFVGKRLASGSWMPSRDMLYYTLLYGFIAPIWIFISGYKALTNSTPRWR